MRTSNYSKMIISTLIVCAVTFSTGYSKATRVDSLGLAGDNFDLYGALELFKKSNSPEEFEKNLNSQGNGINNLDLNGDHQTDYIRVVDQSQGDFHSLVMQDALSANDVQNVAVISMQKINNQIHVQIKGDEALYGKDYIIEPSDPSNNQTINSQNSTGYNNNNQNSNGYNNNNNGQNSNSNYDPNYPNSNSNNNNNNNNGYTNNNYNNNGQNGNGYNNNDTYNNYNNGSNNYNQNYSYGGQYQSVNVVAWPAVQFIYGPQYVPYASPWQWNAYPGWWNPWRTVGWPAYYGRMNMYHPYYSPVNNVNRFVGYPHQAYYPNRSYAPSTTLIQNRYTNVNNSVHYGPRNNGIGNSTGNMRSNGFNGGGGGFHGGGGGFSGGGGGFHGGGGFSGGGGGFHGGGGGGFHGGGGGFSGGGGGRRR